jgi:hypothetical protein
VDCALAGAADDPTNPATFVYLRQAGLLAGDEFPAAGGAYVVMERWQTARRDGRPVYARIADIQLQGTGEAVSDPLAARMGRSFAAAPAILFALAAQAPNGPIRICGVDRHSFRSRLEAEA